MQKTVVIMAAGMGSRYGGLKQLDRIGPSKETIIDYSVYDALRAGFTKIVFVIRSEIETAFREQLGSRFSDRIEVRYVFQKITDIPKGISVPDNRTKPWGPGHAMLTAAPETGDPFIVINADDFYGKEAFQLASGYLESINAGELKAALIGYLLKNTLSEHGTVSRGICRCSPKGTMIDVEEVHGIYRNSGGKLISDNREGFQDDEITSMNMWAFSPAVFEYARNRFRKFLTQKGGDQKSEFYIPQIVNALIQEESLGVQVLETDSEWYGVTYREDKPRIVASVQKLVARGVYPEKLWV